MTKWDLMNRLDGQKEYDTVLRLADDRISEPMAFESWLDSHGYGFRLNDDGEIVLTGTWMIGEVAAEAYWPALETSIRKIQPLVGDQWYHLSSPYGNWKVTILATDEANGTIEPLTTVIALYWDAVPDVEYDENSVDFLP